jgi:hypothetical protein
MLPRGFVPVVIPLALPPRKAGSRATTWLHARASCLGSASSRGRLLCCHVVLHPWWLPWLSLPERRAPVLPRGSTPVVTPMAPLPREVGSRVATWLYACDDSLASASPRGGLSCCCVALCSWLHPSSASPRGGLRCCLVALGGTVSSSMTFNAPNAQCPSLRPTPVMTLRVPVQWSRGINSGYWELHIFSQ